jgi:hypothetical protein
VPNQLETVTIQKVVDIFLPAGIKIIEAEDVMTILDEPFAEM